MSDQHGKHVLFVLPASRSIYSKAKLKVGVPERPSLTYATLAAPLLQRGCYVRVLDLDIVQDTRKALEDELRAFSPDIVGVTCTTPLVSEVRKIASLSKECNPNTIVVAGGPHPSAFPSKTLNETGVDVVCQGEGDYALAAIVDSNDWASIPGITYWKDGQVISNQRPAFIEDLDSLPFPAWNLFDLNKYKTPRLSCRMNPVGTMETSRGCVFGCTYCNKTVFGRTFRPKSARRVVDEMKYMLDQGFAEIHIMDDGFTTDLVRAKQICQLIIEEGLKFPWALHNGVRVDRVDQEFLHKARAAGCYEIAFGIETGDAEILKRINKEITFDQARQAVKWAKDAGLEIFTYFMIGLPGETEDSLKSTIEFALELDTTYSKVSILLPLPGTALFEELEENGLIKTKEWACYNQHDPSGVYDHPNLTWDTIMHYYDLFYRRYYLRPNFIWRRLKKNAFSLNLVYDAIGFLRTRW